MGLAINKRDRVCLVGRNGEGKSTLLRIIAGQTKPDAGEMEIPKNGLILIAKLEAEYAQLSKKVVLADYYKDTKNDVAADVKKLEQLEADTLAAYERWEEPKSFEK